MGIIIFAVIGFYFTGCASLAKPQKKTLDGSIPLEEQAQIIIGTYLYPISIDGQPWKGGRVMNIPAGTHTFTLNCVINAGSSSYSTTYSVNGLSHTDTFESGRLYRIMPQWDKLGAGGKIWTVTSHEGYSEFKKPGPDETLVVLRRKKGGILFNAGNSGEIRITVNEKDTYPTWAGQTIAILLPKGEQKLKIGNQGSAYLTVDAGGGNRRYFAVSRTNLLLVKVKEINK